jgi:hypothetical protein
MTHAHATPGAPVPATDRLAALLRRFAVDFLTGQSWNALPGFMAADYRLNIGGHVIAGREAQYVPAMIAAFEQFPGLCVTVHDVVLGEGAMAMHFTEHGASLRDDGRTAAWQGVSMFRVEDGQMQVGWAEEDYYGRKRQLRAGGECDAIGAPHPAPWDARAERRDDEAERVAREWLHAGGLTAARFVRWAGGPDDPDVSSLIHPHATHVDELFSAGQRVAFHATVRGVYAGGFVDVEPGRRGAPVVLRAAGLLTLQGGVVTAATVVPDRLGMRRSLKPR